jgi:hypothetical protein
VDADGGTNPHRKSISGYVFTIAGVSFGFRHTFVSIESITVMVCRVQTESRGLPKKFAGFFNN